MLAQYFLEQFQNEYPSGLTSISPRLMKLFEQYGWPGNVREMQQVLERAAIFAGDGDCIFPEHVTFSADEGD